MKSNVNFTGSITPAKIVAVYILTIGLIALYKDAEGVTYIAILAGAGLYGWRKTEQRKIITNNNGKNK
jgi:hypothetical protein